MPNSAQMDPAELTTQQLSAIDLIASGIGVVKTAEMLGVNRHTITRWRTRNPFFIAQLNTRRKELWNEAHERLRGMVTKSLDVMESALDSGDSKIAIEVLKAVDIYGKVGPPLGSTNADIVIAEMAERRAKDILATPPGDPINQALYLRGKLPVFTNRIYHNMKSNIKKYTGAEEEHVDSQPGTE